MLSPALFGTLLAFNRSVEEKRSPWRLRTREIAEKTLMTVP
jgi:hypothetical protein